MSLQTFLPQPQTENRPKVKLLLTLYDLDAYVKEDTLYMSIYLGNTVTSVSFTGEPEDFPLIFDSTIDYFFSLTDVLTV